MIIFTACHLIQNPLKQHLVH